MMAGDTNDLQVATRDVYEIEIHIFIYGPNSSGWNIDVFLQLLIGKLKQLWSSRALTYDVSRKQNFLMKVALMLIINDFPAYEMVSD
jgi:hypothetical protein